MAGLGLLRAEEAAFPASAAAAAAGLGAAAHAAAALPHRVPITPADAAAQVVAGGMHPSADGTGLAPLPAAAAAYRSPAFATADGDSWDGEQEDEEEEQAQEEEAEEGHGQASGPASACTSQQGSPACSSPGLLGAGGAAVAHATPQADDLCSSHRAMGRSGLRAQDAQACAGPPRKARRLLLPSPLSPGAGTMGEQEVGCVLLCTDRQEEEDVGVLALPQLPPAARRPRSKRARTVWGAADAGTGEAIQQPGQDQGLQHRSSKALPPSYMGHGHGSAAQAWTRIAAELLSTPACPAVPAEVHAAPSLHPSPAKQGWISSPWSWCGPGLGISLLPPFPAHQAAAAKEEGPSSSEEVDPLGQSLPRSRGSQSPEHSSYREGAVAATSAHMQPAQVLHLAGMQALPASLPQLMVPQLPVLGLCPSIFSCANLPPLSSQAAAPAMQPALPALPAPPATAAAAVAPGGTGASGGSDGAAAAEPSAPFSAPPPPHSSTEAGVEEADLTAAQIMLALLASVPPPSAPAPAAPSLGQCSGRQGMPMAGGSSSMAQPA